MKRNNTHSFAVTFAGAEASAIEEAFAGKDRALATTAVVLGIGHIGVLILSESHARRAELLINSTIAR